MLLWRPFSFAYLDVHCLGTIVKPISRRESSSYMVQRDLKALGMKIMGFSSSKCPSVTDKQVGGHMNWRCWIYKKKKSFKSSFWDTITILRVLHIYTKIYLWFQTHCGSFFCLGTKLVEAIYLCSWLRLDLLNKPLGEFFFLI
jgi:hypothetical protein